MADVREQILERLFAVCGSIAGITTALRNQNSVSETLLPALIVFDADEIADENDPKSRPANAPRRVTMTPEVRILRQSAPEAIGSDLNAIRAKLIKAVLTDSALLAFTAEGQGARYMGAASQLKSGRSMEGDMLCVFAFHYYLKPNDL